MTLCAVISTLHFRPSFVPPMSRTNWVPPRRISRKVSLQKEIRPSPRPRYRRSFLCGANDWQILVDYNDWKITFLPSIYCTPGRPDIIIWSVLAKRVLLIELTCPAEEGISGVASRKLQRYKDLTISTVKIQSILALCGQLKLGPEVSLAHQCTAT